jgi:predicted NUDIX family phosphoesterase
MYIDCKYKIIVYFCLIFSKIDEVLYNRVAYNLERLHNKYHDASGVKHRPLHPMSLS